MKKEDLNSIAALETDRYKVAELIIFYGSSSVTI